MGGHRRAVYIFRPADILRTRLVYRLVMAQLPGLKENISSDIDISGIFIRNLPPQPFPSLYIAEIRPVIRAG